MYEILNEGEHPLSKENIFYIGDTSTIYKENDLLYKVYLKKEPFKRQVLDYLILKYDNLKDISVPPKGKLKIGNNYGMKMNYVKSIDFLSYIRDDNFTTEEMIRILKILSNNLKIINQEQIHFSDLHHHNIIIKEDGYPLYIDLDDACIKDYSSTHISVMCYRLHDLENKDYQYEDDLIKYGNLDRESLSLMLLDYILDEAVEKYKYDDFQKKVEMLDKNISPNIIELFSNLKSRDKQIYYPYYIGDYLYDGIIDDIKVLKLGGKK